MNVRLGTAIRVTLSVAAATLAFSALAFSNPAEPASASATQRTLFDFTGAQTPTSYWEPELNQPRSFTDPVNFAAGTIYIKLEVTEKPSDTRMWPQLCFWRHAAKNYQFETCSSTRLLELTEEGTYYLNAESLDSWWQKNDNFDWSQQVSLGRIMMKDPDTKKLFIGAHCGTACYVPDPEVPGDVVENHVPIHFRATTIMVAEGATLNPPSDWIADCPTEWSPQCGTTDGSTDGGPPVSTTGGPTTIVSDDVVDTSKLQYATRMRSS